MTTIVSGRRGSRARPRKEVGERSRQPGGQDHADEARSTRTSAYTPTAAGPPVHATRAVAGRAGRAQPRARRHWPAERAPATARRASGSASSPPKVQGGDEREQRPHVPYMQQLVDALATSVPTTAPTSACGRHDGGKAAGQGTPRSATASRTAPINNPMPTTPSTPRSTSERVVAVSLLHEQRHPRAKPGLRRHGPAPRRPRAVRDAGSRPATRRCATLFWLRPSPSAGSQASCGGRPSERSRDATAAPPSRGSPPAPDRDGRRRRRSSAPGRGDRRADAQGDRPRSIPSRRAQRRGGRTRAAQDPARGRPDAQMIISEMT